ncbi:hypothetical protein HMPREF1221_00558 [Treponema socranskii subsp. paredis ATCC 35535]|nr:hypothetical protein HMPREF1221_00558 [Treponema socranskii subsp. paredis ATCC 35535]
MRYFSVQFKLGQNGSAAVPLPRVPPFLFICALFYIYISGTITLNDTSPKVKKKLKNR